mmetsp:Transcript_38140/g.89428  ORF Transcript_38140/g.89428 Transcript_38140/m.89428 type:complete len:335 (-) Transcript_38140:61-1065(-)
MAAVETRSAVEPAATGPLPESLLPFAALLFARFPEVFLALGHPNLGKDFDVPPSPVSSVLIEETKEYKLVQVVLGRKGALRAPTLPFHPPLAGTPSSVLGGLDCMRDAANHILMSPSGSRSVSSAGRFRPRAAPSHEVPPRVSDARSAISSPGSSFKDAGQVMAEAPSFAASPAQGWQGCQHRGLVPQSWNGEEDSDAPNAVEYQMPMHHLGARMQPAMPQMPTSGAAPPQEPCSPRLAGAGFSEEALANARPAAGAPHGALPGYATMGSYSRPSSQIHEQGSVPRPFHARPAPRDAPAGNLQPGPSGGGSQGRSQGGYEEPQSPRTPGKYKAW